MGNKTIIISGPTATGKTDLALEVNQVLAAQGINSEIVNFDSLLFYKELNIGTAKPEAKLLNQIPHHMVNIESVSNHLNAAAYERGASKVISRLHNEGKTVILAGGSGFYLRALIKGMYQGKETPKHIKDLVQGMFDTHGIKSIIELLKKNDPDIVNMLHENDHYRLIRALEYNLSTNKKISVQRHHMDSLKPYDLTRADWDIFHIYLDIPKPAHQEIIKNRAQTMLKNGLLDEVDALLKKGYRNTRPMASIGYKESVQFLDGTLKSEAEYLERIVISTRQLAKAQRTWFKKVNKISYNFLTDKNQLSHDVMSFIR